jgi:hypothetical protein
MDKSGLMTKADLVSNKTDNASLTQIHDNAMYLNFSIICRSFSTLVLGEEAELLYSFLKNCSKPRTSAEDERGFYEYSKEII